MPQDVSIVLHGGHGQLPFVTYLYRVLLHLLALAAVAVGTRLGITVFTGMATEATTESNTEKQEQ